jgi:DNA-binding transcriptional ArsR family regulator
MPDGSRKLARAKMAVLTSPLRLAIVTSLGFRAASAAELATEIGVPVEKVRYHLKRLREVDLVTSEGTTRRRGVTETLYSADAARQIISKEEVAHLSPHGFAQAQTRLLRLMFRDASEAVGSVVFAKRSDYGFIRFPLPLDEQGWPDALAIHDQALQKILKVKEESLDRLEAGGETSTRVCAAIIFFERSSRDSK